MKKNLLVAAFSAIAMLFASCEKTPAPVNPDEPGKEPQPKPEVVEVNPASHEFTADGGTFDVTVKSSADWTVSPAQESWVKPSVTSGKDGAKVTFTAEKNSTTEARAAVFTFKVGKKTATFRVSQVAGEAPKPSVKFELQNPADANLKIGADDTAYMLYLKTSLENENQVRHSIDGSWVTSVWIVKANDIQVAVSFNKNTTPNERKATLTLSTDGAADIVVNITQAGKPQTGGGDTSGFGKWIGNWEWKATEKSPVGLTFAEKEKGVSYTVTFTGRADLPSFTVLYDAAKEGLLFTKIPDCGSYQGKKAKFAARYHYEGGYDFSNDCNMAEDRMNIVEMSMSGSEGKTGKIYNSVYGDPFADMGLFSEQDQWTNSAIEPRLALPATMSKK